MEPNPTQTERDEDGTRTESPNLIVSLELLDTGDVSVTINKEAARLGDILTALELGRINVVRMYYENLDRESREGV